MFGRKGFGGGTQDRGGLLTSADESLAAALASASATGSLAAAPLDQPADQPAASADRLVVGPGLTFSGAIAACNHLVVSGHVASDVERCQTVDIAPGGSVRGRVTVSGDADIAGDYDGDLTVLGCLRIRATGHVKGHITYGTLAIEPGGHLLGIIDSLAETQQRTRPVVVPLRPRKPSATAPAADTDGNA